MNATTPRKMASLICLVIYLVISLVPVFAANTSSRMPEPNWDRSLALQAIRNEDTQAILRPLFQMARSGNDVDLLDSLSMLQTDTGLSAPVRDYLLFSFTVGLSDLDTNSVSPEVLGFLSGYRMRTLVPHEEYPRMGVAMFNIRAAASGVRNNWDRQLASKRARILMRGPADQWLLSYLAAGPSERRGFVDALHYAPADRLQALGRAALTQLDDKPELVVISAWAGLQTGDFDLLRHSVARGSGADLPGILKAASRELSVEQNIRLLDQTLREATDSTAGLAIAQLAPAYLDQTEVREILFSNLANRRLGAAVALVLGDSEDPEIRQRLSNIAEQATGLEQLRATLAIRALKTDREAER